MCIGTHLYPLRGDGGGDITLRDQDGLISRGSSPRRLYILCWSELSRRKLSPMLATPTTLVLTTLVAQCELSRRKIGLLLEVVGRKFSLSPGNPATVGVVRWPAADDTAGSSLRRLSSLQHRTYNLLGHLARPPSRAATLPLICLISRSVSAPSINISHTHTHTHTHTQPFNGPFSGTTQVSRYQKETVSGSGISLHPAPDRQPRQHPDALPVAQPTASKH